MLTPMRNQLIWMTTATLVVISASSAHAISFNTLPGYTDAQFNQDKANGLFQEDWVGEGRIGGPTTFEQNIVNWTTNSSNNTPATGEFSWENGLIVPFTMSYSPSNGGTLTYTLGGQTITSSNLTEPSRFPNGINTLYLRTRSTDNSALTLKNLVVDGTNLSDLVSSSTGDGEVDYLQVSELDGDFTLTGEATLSWFGTPPTQSALAFQVKGGYGAVPEPLTLLGVGTALGFGTFFKRALKK